MDCASGDTARAGQFRVPGVARCRGGDQARPPQSTRRVIMQATSRGWTARLGAALLGVAVSGAYAAEPPRNPAEVYGSRSSATRTISVAQPQAQRRSGSTADTFRYWNQIAVDSSGIDHTPVAAG